MLFAIKKKIFIFLEGDVFNMEGNLILMDVDLINFSDQICSGCKNVIFIDFRKIYPPAIIRRIYNGCAQSKQNVQVKNMLPKNHEIAFVSGEIILKKDENFEIIYLEINFDGFLSTHVRLRPINSPIHHLQLLILMTSVLILLAVVMNVNSFFFSAKENDLVCCSCIHQNFRNNDVDFYLNKRFYESINRIFVASCSRHLFLKERIGPPFSDIKSNCESVEKGKCNKCKIKVF